MLRSLKPGSDTPRLADVKAGILFFLVSAVLTSPCTVVCAENSEVLSDGTGVAAWDVARDAERLRREFSVSEVRAATNPPALEWRFVSRGVEPVADVVAHAVFVGKQPGENRYVRGQRHRAR